MSFKYINPGYAKISRVNSNMQINNPNQDTSRTGVCYQYFVEDKFEFEDSFPCFILDSTDNLSDIWIKFDYFCDKPNYEIYVWLPNANEDYLGLYIQVTNYGDYITYYSIVKITIGNSGDNCQKEWTIEDVDEDSLADFGIKLNKFNEVFIHFTYDKSSNYINGTMDVKINGKTFTLTNATQTGGAYTQTWQNSKKGVYILSTESELYNVNSAMARFSNIIISDEEVDTNEKIVPLPILNTQSTMETVGGGFYVADKVGEKILQSPDVYSLANIYDANSKVTGILLIGDPAYTESGTETLVSISSRDSVISEHGAISVTNDTNTLIFQSWTMSSDTTIADLANMSFGWKASE